MGSESSINTVGLKVGTVAGALAAKNALIDKNDKTKDKGNNANIKFFDNVGKMPSSDAMAREKGFANYDELVKYKEKNPHTYAVMGGYYYEPDNSKSNYTPINEEGKIIVAEAQKRDSYIRNLQYVIDKEDALRAQNKRSRGISLTDREIEAEINLQWLNGSVSSNEIVKKIEKAKAVNNAIIKFNNGEEINSDELLLLTENGGANFTNGDTYKTIDFLAEDNPNNIAAKEKYKKAVDKEKKGEELTAQEKADKSNYIARREIIKSITKDKYTFGVDTKKNAENLNTIAATQMYNDAIYEKGIKKTFAQMDLYVNTGMTKFFQDIINTGTVLMTELDYNSGLGDKRASDVLKQIPTSKYEIANNAVAQNFTINNERFSKFVQDVTVSLSHNAIPMLLSGVSGGTSLVATGLSAFGSSYKEAVQSAPDAEEWQYFLYAGMSTATEVCMQKLLSGDTSVFNNSSKFTDSMFKTLTKNVSNKFLIGGAKLLSNSTGEFFEETIQGLLSPVMQESILGVDTISILSPNRTEQLNAMKNALYDGLVGFVSACVSTGIFGNDSIDNINQKQTIGAYYNKVFNDSNINTENVALYLKEISNGENSDLYRFADKVLNGDKTDIAVADMMIDGMEQSREAQGFVYTKIGEHLNQNNRYTVYNLIRQYDRLTKSGIEFSKSITDTYNELVNSEGISRDGFNYLVGKLSTTMDAVAPRASVVNEIKKKINDDIKSNNSLKDFKKSHNNDAFVDGLWDGAENTAKSSVEKSQLDVFDNINEKWYNSTGVITDGSHLVNGKLEPNVKYKSGEFDYIYLTDDSGRIARVHVEELQYTERDYRERHNPNTLGKQQGDHAGHLIADRFGGSPDIDNLVSQSALVNLSEYKKMENIWANALNNGQKISVDIKVQYIGDGMRPSGFTVNYFVDGSKVNQYIEN